MQMTSPLTVMKLKQAHMNARVIVVNQSGVLIHLFKLLWSCVTCNLL